VQTSDCRNYLDLSPGAGTGSRPACKRCDQVEDLLLQEAVRRLCNIRKAKKEIGSGFQAQSAVNPQPPSAMGHPTRKTKWMRPSVGR